MKKKFAPKFLSIVFFISFFCANAQAFEAGKIYSGTTLEEVLFVDILAQAKEGQIFMVGELHGAIKHHDFQRDVIKGLMARKFKVNVGIEHFSYLEQQAIDAYLSGNLTEENLLKTVKLTGFESWREQMQLPLQSGGWSYGINAPRWLTGKINAVGYDLLSLLEKNILPPDFTLGSENYKLRMLEIMGATHPFEGFDKMFQAQSAWDDTSALTLINLLKQDPQSVFVVLFGDFHIAYGGGLPDRLKQRGFTDAVTFSQICSEDFSASELDAAVKPHSVYGPRADYVVVAQCQAP